MKRLSLKISATSLFFLISACQSTNEYNLKTYSEPGNREKNDLHVFSIRSSRVQQECEFLNAEGDQVWRHQYTIYVLSTKKEIIPIMYSINQDKGSCETQLNKVKKLLKEDFVRICARWPLKETKVDPKDGYKKIKFGPLGSYYETHEPLIFQSICNSKECYDYEKVFIDTCPGFQLR